MRNKIRLEKKLKLENLQREKNLQKVKTISNAKQQQEQEQEAKRRLDTEVMHQTEEAETRALGRAMMADAAGKRPSFNTSCLNLLNNFSGNA